MKTQYLLVVLLLATFAGMADWALSQRPKPTMAATPPVTASAAQSTLTVIPAAVAVAAPAAEVVRDISGATSLAAAAKPPKLPIQKNRPPKDPIQDPQARVALSGVGADPEAEAYWMGAINDPSLPAEERKDLIEDLNEEGLADPHHPTPEDLPLIASRLQLIEELAPSAMDQVNADAFQEAHKDLVNLMKGMPVR